jgi:hypothetical protein
MRKDGRETESSKAGTARWPPSKRRLRKMIEEAIVDAHTESEQQTGLFTMIDWHLAVPFDTEVLVAIVSVLRIDITSADEIVAVCRRGGKHQSIPILDLPLTKPPPAGRNGSRHAGYGRKVCNASVLAEAEQLASIDFGQSLRILSRDVSTRPAVFL